MDNCKKCGTGTMKGPRYVKDDEGEWLVYRCDTCKFKERVPCVDAKKRVSIEMPPEAGK